MLFADICHHRESREAKSIMQRKKKMSVKALLANRENGKLSPGPRTPEGKSRSSKSAIKVGFFCRAFHVPEADRPIYERMRAGIEEQLQPRTILQRLWVDIIIHAAWRCRQASQLDAQYLNKKLSQPADEGEGVPEPAKLPITAWYGLNARAMRAALHMIDIIIPEVRDGGQIPEVYVQDVKQAFGLEFYETLTEWDTAELDHLWLIQNMIEKSKQFDLDYKRVMEEAKRETEEGQSKKRKPVPQSDDIPVKIVKDPLERAHMVIKLLQQKKEQLLEMQHVLKYVDGSVAGQQISEPPCRYVGWAFRQLEKALESYLRLVEAGL